jgi:hypothetical protein
MNHLSYLIGVGVGHSATLGGFVRGKRVMASHPRAIIDDGGNCSGFLRTVES